MTVCKPSGPDGIAKAGKYKIQVKIFITRTSQAVER